MAIAGVLLDLILAALLCVVRAHGETAGQWHAEGPWATIAFAVLVAGPGLAGLAGIRTRRAELLAAAGLACLPVAMLSIALFPLVASSVLLLVAFARHPIASLGRTALTCATLVTATIAAIGMLLTTAPYNYSFPGGGESGGYVPGAHAGLAIALVLVGVAAATAVATLGPRYRAVTRRARSE